MTGTPDVNFRMYTKHQDSRFQRVSHLTSQESTQVIAISVRSCQRKINIQQDRITNTSRLRYPSVLSLFCGNIRLTFENADKATTTLSFFQQSVGSAAKSSTQALQCVKSSQNRCAEIVNVSFLQRVPKAHA